MTASDHSRRFRYVRTTSALPPIATIKWTCRQVGSVATTRHSSWDVASDDRGISRSVLSRRTRRSSRDELLPAVDVVGRTRQCRVAHDVNGQRGDVSRPDDAPVGQRRAELVASLVEVVAEEGCREGSVDESCGDQIDADRRELERKAGDEGG